MTAQSLLTELSNAGVVLEAVDGRLRLTAGRGTLTPNLLSAVKNCKAGLLEILQNRYLFLSGSGVGEQRAADVRATPNAPEYSTTQPPSKADVEWDRFLACAIPMPDGNGLYDPAFGPEVPAGVVWGAWQAFERDCASMGRGGNA